MTNSISNTNNLRFFASFLFWNKNFQDFQSRAPAGSLKLKNKLCLKFLKWYTVLDMRDLSFLVRGR